MKRIMRLMTLLIILSITSSCNPGTKIFWPDKSESSDTQKKHYSGTTLIVAFPLIRNLPSDINLIQDAINKIVVKSLNINIKLVGISNVNYEQKCRLMLASQEKVDLISTGTLLNMDYSREVANSQLLRLNDLVDKYGSSIKNSLGEFLNCGKINGNIYGIPTLRDEAKAAGFAIRKDLVEKYSLDLTKVKSLKDIEPILKTLKEKEPSITPFFTGQDSMSGLEQSMRIPNGDPLASDHFFSGVLINASSSKLKVVDYYETPEYLSMIKLARKWNKAGYLLPNVITNDDSAYILIRTGKIASYLQDVKPGIQGQISKQCARKMLIVPISTPVSNTSTVTGFMWGIPAYAKSPELSMKLLNLLYSDPRIVNLLSWGLEGRHYVKMADGRINYPNGVNVSNTGYDMNEGFIFGNQMLSYVWDGDPVNLWKQMDSFNKIAIKSKALGFFFDATPVEPEYDACTGIWQGYQKALGVGAVDPEKVLPEFIMKLKVAGVDKIVAEKQRQLDLWAKKNHIE